ncbi:MAG: type II toxin-antitoxin system prevent-host-death family antitoxin [Polyangiaceae bacterium]|nr:type II toxin-antitoxin system prevent-host-death family antitoxin [Polyangiaceae bacterium]
MSKRSPTTMTMTQARAAFAKVLTRAEAGDAVEVTRDGQPVAMIVGLRQYREGRALSESPSAAFQSFMAGLDPRELRGRNPWRALRDQSAGRKFRW